jgi:hypothetical protein
MGGCPEEGKLLLRYGEFGFTAVDTTVNQLTFRTLAFIFICTVHYDIGQERNHNLGKEQASYEV